MPTTYCRHIRTNGRRCCSPALRTSAFCYYHGHSIERHRGLNPPAAADAMPTIIHPLNTDEHRQREPILAEYFSGVAPNPAPLVLNFPALEDRESIQVALSMLISALGQHRLDPTGQELAPDEDPQEIIEFNQWLENYDEDEEEDDED